MRIKEILKARQMTVAELAKLIERSPEQTSRMINGNPRLDSLRKIADALKCGVSELVEDEGETSFICPNCKARFTINLKK